MFSSSTLLAAQANAGEIKTKVILISNEMPDENTDQDTTHDERENEIYTHG